MANEDKRNELAKRLFERRYHHTVRYGDYETFEQLEKKCRNYCRTLLAVVMLIGLPSLLAILLAAICADSFFSPLPDWVIVPFLLFMCIGFPSSVALLEHWRFRKECDIRGFGMWTVDKRHLSQFYGKETLSCKLDSITNIRVNRRMSQIYFDTNDGQIIVSCRLANKRDSSQFLPFLNAIIERLSKYPVDISPLLVVQETLRKNLIFCSELLRQYLWSQLAFVVAPLWIIAVLSTSVRDYIEVDGVTPTFEAIVLGGFLAIVLLLVAFFIYLGRRINQRHKIFADKIYESLIAAPSVNKKKKRSLFNAPPRIITVAARRRLRFGWGGLLGACMASLLWCFIVGIAVSIPELTVGERLYGYFFTSLFALLGVLIVICDRQKGNRYAHLLENGVTIYGRIKRISTFKITVRTSPEYGGMITLANDEDFCDLELGERVLIFIDPQDHTKRFLYKQATEAVFYDAATNTFDAKSRLLVFQLPLAIAFCATFIWFVVLVCREIITATNGS